MSDDRPGHPGQKVPPRTLGAVLAGGHSLRMGSDKAAIVVRESSLLAHTLGALDQFDHVAVFGRRRSMPDVPSATAWFDDAVQDRGPLGGLLTAAQQAQRLGCAWTVFAPCDLPGLRSGDLRDLAECAWSADRTTELVVTAGQDRPNWVLGALRTTALTGLERAIGDGIRSLHQAFAPLNSIIWRPPDTAALNDVDTTAELEQWKLQRRSE